MDNLFDEWVQELVSDGVYYPKAVQIVSAQLGLEYKDVIEGEPTFEQMSIEQQAEILDSKGKQ